MLTERFLTAARLAVFLMLSCTGLEAQPAPAVQCASCHDQSPQLEKSAHSGLQCGTCHAGHDAFPHPADIPKPACATCHQIEGEDYAGGVHGQARKSGNEAAPECGTCHGGAHELLGPRLALFRASVPDTCGVCHGEVAGQFRESIHGKALARGDTQAPICTDCHGGHKILKRTDGASTVHQGNIRDTCGRCHGDVYLARKFGMPPDRLVSFDASFHGLAAKAGSQSVANCASCHGFHNILPSSDPQSTIHAANLPKTCGQCHPGAGSRFAISQVHLVEGRSEATGTLWVRRIYLVLIPVTLGLMLLHNAGDWIRKLIRARFASSTRSVVAPADHARGGLRMLPFERVQHALLAVSFITLAWTGFALKYPDQWWARPLLLLEGPRSVRSLVHRTAAAVFLVTAAMHVGSLIFNRSLREHWRNMLPKFRDVREALAGLTYNLGLRSRPPVRSAHSYIEKAEYLAVVWGSAVMAVSGVPLWANNLALQWFPKAWLDVATSVHFYEAVLATAAIVVWHFYFVILDPDVYPLDTAFLTGFRSRQPARPPEPMGPGEPPARAD